MYGTYVYSASAGCFHGFCLGISERIKLEQCHRYSSLVELILTRVPYGFLLRQLQSNALNQDVPLISAPVPRPRRGFCCLRCSHERTA